MIDEGLCYLSADLMALVRQSFSAIQGFICLSIRLVVETQIHVEITKLAHFIVKIEGSNQDFISHLDGMVLLAVPSHFYQKIRLGYQNFEIHPRREKKKEK